MTESVAASAFHDPRRYALTTALEAAFEDLRAEAGALPAADFVESPDSLTTASGRYDERGWRYFALFGGGAECAANQRRCPRTTSVCASIAGLVNAGFSLFQPGTHLYPHRGEMSGVLRCHLPLSVPPGDLGLRSGAETRRWEAGRCLVFDDHFEHEAWNHGRADRVVLIVTFRP